MKNARFGIIVALAVLAGIFVHGLCASEIEIGYSFAAIAYSPSKGEFGYAYNHRSRSAAEKAALRECDAPDAEIVCWVNKGFCALALGDDKTTWGVGWRYGGGSNNTDAMKAAMEECATRTTGAHIALCLSSDGQYIYQPEKEIAPIQIGDPVARRIFESADFAERLKNAGTFASLSSSDPELKALNPAQRLRLGLAYALGYPDELDSWIKALRSSANDSLASEARSHRTMAIAQIKFAHKLDSSLADASNSDKIEKILRGSKQFVDLVSKAAAQANVAGQSSTNEHTLSAAFCKALAGFLLSD